MEIFEKPIYAWQNACDKNITAIAAMTGDYFHAGMNVMRDGDMGCQDENGDYDRIWFEDDIYEDEKPSRRFATAYEAGRYIRKVGLQNAVGDLCCDDEEYDLRLVHHHNRVSIYIIRK